jgi:hypothetical protein
MLVVAIECINSDGQIEGVIRHDHLVDGVLSIVQYVDDTNYFDGT